MSEHQKRIISISEKVKKFFEDTFCKLDVNGPSIDFDKIKGSPLMIVSTHRSHLDYFVVPYVFFKMGGISNFRFAAGDNLTNLPYIGKKFRSLGAFTVKRDIGFDRRYIQTLCYDTVSMIERGETVLVFPEGGRSYSGDILTLRNGITAALIISQSKDYKRDVFFIPSTVVYDYPPDVKWFSMLLRGKLLRKKTNNFFNRLKGNILYFGAD
ncbi:MAG: 1-acyl-sn-glycerol-3-phosphate acyltransferase, partial [Chitinispirillaceae bacterium]|nr:1-acyl-sn-glycerol-3-phosphate acyltransferase [Chitinispirillaceae bacterium]